jgi:hypothetical protein
MELASFLNPHEPISAAFIPLSALIELKRASIVPD